MTPGELSDGDIDRFIDNGFLLVQEAFPRSVADAGREVLRELIGLSRHDPASWTQPLVRIEGSAAEPFRHASMSPRLLGCFDQLVGEGRWVPSGTGMGTFPIRFPSEESSGDLGWHCDGSFGEWPFRLNVKSRGRALLMLFLFSDVGPDDAPTRIRVGSHLDIPPVLLPYGDDGVDFLELAQRHFGPTEHRPISEATGKAGDVYLCHPFLVHAAQKHRGTQPRFIAQPPLHPAEPIQIERLDSTYSPVEMAIRVGLGIRD